MNDLTSQIKFRDATDAETIEWYMRHYTSVTFRRFTSEFASAGSNSGFTRSERTRARPFVRDGKLMANYRGKPVVLTATHATLPNGSKVVLDLRIADPNLPRRYPAGQSQQEG